MYDKLLLRTLMCLALGFCCLRAYAGGPPWVVTITPKATDDLLANPGMGWQTFYQCADDDDNLAGLPSGSAYIRFYWRDLEPEEGKIDFAKFGDLLAHAHRVGQKLGFRIMIASTDGNASSGAPDWLRAKGCKGYEYQYEGSGHTYWVPDFDDPAFKEAHFRLIREMGRRYDGHPDLDYVDIGSVGLWGEWHMSGTQVAMPPVSTRLTIIDAYLKAFPHTPKLMLIGDADGMKYAIAHGTGWRADCLGDMGGFSRTWSHMRDAYPQEIEAAGAENIWKRAPVAWETCWDMRKWVQEGWDVRYIFDYALAHHASYVNNKSAPIPTGYRPEVERLIRKLGYRLELRSVTVPAQIAPGGAYSVKMAWANVGVAPPYHDYSVAFRLTDTKGKTAVVLTKQSIKGWLPGSIDTADTLRIPTGLARGECRLAVGVVDLRTRVPAVRLAIEGRDEDGWYPLCNVEIK